MYGSKSATAKRTVPDLRAAKGREKIAMVTAYDYTMARIVDAAGVDMILVGDSLGMVVQGRANTLGVTLEEIAYHTRCVLRGVERAHVVGDMPFLSYQVSSQDAVQHAGRLIQEGAESVKLEGGIEFAETVYRITRAGIPVVGHVGLLPQSVHAMGGFKVQGRGDDAARVIRDAKALEQAGAFAVVIEGVPPDVAREITKELSIPTIGIGAGPHCDGQVLVSNDLLGLSLGNSPKFVKRYAELGENAASAVAAYVDEVRKGTFPGREHTYRSNESREDRSPGRESTNLPIDAPLELDYWH